jgi:hypothetical protein
VALDTYVTVRVAAVVIAEPAEFVNTARTFHPFSKEKTGPLRLVVVAVAFPEMFAQVEPPSVEYCHWTAGEGIPRAAALNVTVPPEGTLWSRG